MAGRVGRNRAWNKISPEEHLRRGTYRADRHASKAGLLQAWPEASPREPPEPLPAAVLEGLTGRGLVFVQEAWASYYGWRVEKLVLLRETGLLIDQLETARGTKAEPAIRRALLQTLTLIRFDLIQFE